MPLDNKIQTHDYDPKNPHCDQEQLKFLKKCIAESSEGIKKWNQWRYENEDTEIWLQQAELESANLEAANLRGAHMEGVDLLGAYLKNTILGEAHLEGVDLSESYLRGVDLNGSHLEGANLSEAPLEETDLTETHLEGASLRRAHLEGAYLEYAHLEEADFSEAHLEGASFQDSNLQGADFSGAIVNGETLLNEACKVDHNTKFEAVGLDSMRIYSSTKQLLEYNIRRMNWEDWYWGNEAHIFFRRFVTKRELILGACCVIGRLLLTSPVRLFWSMSDYGLRTWRIIEWFFGLAVTFAIAYRLWPNCVLVNGQVGDIRGFVHVLYFSVVTMTTLGFGDIAANPDSWQGQVLLMVQVILGYVLLGALVTRFAVLFTAGGPAGKFAK
ncbi:MAG: pentapeptide repeat-containing protein [Planctomycetes bacterium]|nr:pentapeptide repeat-containing protein [Planctomycetota bacterium]MBL7145217.1 pentapeptide repeat-containing protein [Phycisphaerae bacterium]